MNKFLAVIFTLLIAMGAAFAQIPSGITGTVTDPGGAVVPGVKVTLLDTQHNITLTTTTNDQGSYTFNNLQPGPGFQLTFTVSGFQTFVLNNLNVPTGQTQTENAQLKTGQVSERVEVTATSGEVTLNTTDAT